MVIMSTSEIYRVKNSIKHTPLYPNAVKPTRHGNPSANEDSSGDAPSDFGELLKALRKPVAVRDATGKKAEAYAKNAAPKELFQTLIDIRI